MNTSIKYLFIIGALSFCLYNPSFAQIENVIIENYYIADILDASDSIGGKLEPGSKTYRIYIDLKPGSKLKKIYGSAFHPLLFASTSSFFNNKEDGQNFAKDFSKSRYENNTVALDSWLTLGQTTRLSSSTNFGVLKIHDRNGSFIGGINNDGGSADISTGLLINQDPWAGIPLTTADGMDTMSIVPKDWLHYGFQDVAGNDTTIFGSELMKNEFKSFHAGLQNSGVSGVIVDSNQVLIAQLTTTGDLRFEINLEVDELMENGNRRIVKYVANDTLLAQDEIFNPILKYPYTCGCQDPNYLESQKKYACEDKSACKTLIVFGCTDSLACNYNVLANFNIQTICCYIGYCNDLRINEVCPNLKERGQKQSVDFEIYPIPANEQIVVNILTSFHSNYSYNIYNSVGMLVLKNELPNFKSLIDVSSLNSGLYYIRVSSNDISAEKVIFKN